MMIIISQKMIIITFNFLVCVLYHTRKYCNCKNIDQRFLTDLHVFGPHPTPIISSKKVVLGIPSVYLRPNGSTDFIHISDSRVYKSWVDVRWCEHSRSINTDASNGLQNKTRIFLEKVRKYFTKFP
jgi:hypothetical protein